MANTLSRKFFSRRVTIPSNQAITYLALMKLAPATTNTPAWGTNADGTPSLDATWGDGATLIPASQTIYVGMSADVAAVNSTSQYIGVPAAAGTPFSLQDYAPGPVDLEQVFIYSVNAQDVDLIMQGRQ